MPPKMSVKAGRYIGVAARGCVSWRGVRYATAERWGLPTLCATPRDDILCDAYGPPIAQAKGAFMPMPSLVEDSLLLNIHSPAADGARRPVMVFIHGGAFLFGSGSDYDGTKFAEEGDIVVVTINYRLGVLGFGDFSALGVPRNLGLHDQIAALRWVRENIAAFGGDPDCITIVGESAGSMSISLLMVSSAREGLFDRAILQSGALNLIHESDIAADLGRRYREILGSGAADLDALRQVPLEQLLSAQAKIDAEVLDGLPASPVYDGDLLPASLSDALRTDTPSIPMIAGSNRDEVRLFATSRTSGILHTKREKILALVRDQHGTEFEREIASLYADTKSDNFNLGSDINFSMSTRLFAERHAAAGNPSWAYRFDRGGVLFGATHAIELTYLWPTTLRQSFMLRGGFLIGDRARLGKRLRQHWISFVRSGDPGADWPRYEAGSRSVKLFDKRDSIAHDPDGERRSAWAGRELLPARPIRELPASS
jgi:para-nitrobenzyl esterase